MQRSFISCVFALACASMAGLAATTASAQPTGHCLPPEVEGVPNVPVTCPTPPSGYGLTVIADEGVNCYSRDFRFTTSAFTDTGAYASRPAVRVTLPPSYYADLTRKYPVIYLLHGANESVANYGGSNAQYASYTSWTGTCNTSGRIIQTLTEEHATDVILVSLEGGRLGYFNNWAITNNGTLDYETFHLDQVIPWVEENFNIRRTRESRAIAGLSMGGYGAMKYAAKRPDLFVSAASFSGALNSQDRDAVFRYSWNPGVGEVELLKAISIMMTGEDFSLYGSTNYTLPIWTANNPTKLAENLRNTNLYITNGLGCQAWESGCDLGASAFETEGAARVTRDFRTALEYARPVFGSTPALIPYEFRAMSGGAKATHSWPNWREAFKLYIHDIYPRLQSGSWEPRVAQPSVYAHVFGANILRLYGWRIDMRTAAGGPQPSDQDIKRLVVNGTSGFTLEGSGNTKVITGRIFTPGSWYRVALTNPAITTAIPTQYVSANSAGQLTLAVFPVSTSGIATTTATITKL